MKVLNVTVVTNAEETTANAKYGVEYEVVDGGLKKLTATVHEERQVDNGIVDAQGEPVMEKQFVVAGQLMYQDGMIRPAQFPYNTKYALFVSDFMQIIGEVTKAE